MYTVTILIVGYNENIKYIQLACQKGVQIIHCCDVYCYDMNSAIVGYNENKKYIYSQPVKKEYRLYIVVIYTITILIVQLLVIMEI